MARQAGPLYFTGTIDSLTFYKMDGEYYARKKSCLDKKRFYRDPAFARSRQSATAFGGASKLASAIYRHLPKEARKKGVIGKLTGQVGHLLREGKSPEEVKVILLKHRGIEVTSAPPQQPVEASPVQKREEEIAVKPMFSKKNAHTYKTIWVKDSYKKALPIIMMYLPGEDIIRHYYRQSLYKSQYIKVPFSTS